MRTNRGRTARGLGLAALLLWAAGCGGSPEVEAIRPHVGEIVESFTEPARTRLAKTYRVAMPVAGRLERVDLEPGDKVTAGQELVVFDRLPLEKAVEEAKASVAELGARITVKDDNRLEKTALVETNATVRAADEALKAADAQIEAEKIHADHAAKEFRRMETLAREQAISESTLDQARVDADTALIELRRQEFYRAALNALVVAVKLGPRYVEQYLERKKLERIITVSQLAQARARLARAEHELALARVRSPIDGVVLERFEQGDRTVPAGQPLLLVGNLDALEVIADVMTQSALRLRPAGRVVLESAVGRRPIDGTVARIEPAGFTKLSSLGVEQQRVNVIVSLAAKPEGLGVGYRLQARFLTGSKSDALVVPRFSVLQSADQSFYVMKIEAERLKKRTVRIGLRSDL